MKIGNLHITRHKNVRHWTLVQISWQWKWSLTWRWIFTIAGHDQDCNLGFYATPRLKGWNTRWFDIALFIQPNMFHYKLRDAKVAKWIRETMQKDVTKE